MRDGKALPDPTIGSQVVGAPRSVWSRHLLRPAELGMRRSLRGSEMFELYGTSEGIISRIAGVALRQALDYWKSIVAVHNIPSRNEVDPMAIPNLLPTTFIMIAEENGEFRYQLAGSKIEQKFALGALAGKTPQEIMGERSKSAIEAYRRVRDETVLYYRDANVAWISHREEYCQNEVLLMPLSNDGVKVNMILGVQDFFRDPVKFS